MRLQRHINEVSRVPEDTVLELIRKNCKPFLKESGGQFLFRGTKKRVPRGMAKITTRPDRRPLDTPKELHDYMDKHFKKKFGWKGRSEGVFCLGDEHEASVYGYTYAMFPIGQFKFIWSPSIMDLTSDFREEEILVGTDYGNEDDWEGGDNNPRFQQLIKTYTDKNLKKAIRSDNEIMIKCKEYYLVDDDQYLLQELYGWKR